MPDLTELLTYYVIVAVVFVGAPGVFFFIVFMPALQNTRDEWSGIRITKLMVIRPSTRIHQVITRNTPYKLAEIIRDTWPQLFYLRKETNNGSKHTKSSDKGVV